MPPRDNYGFIDYLKGNQAVISTEWLYLTNDTTNFESSMDLLFHDGLLYQQPVDSGLSQEAQVENHDDYCALALSPFRKYAQAFLKYGLKHFFRYDNRKPLPMSFKEIIRTVRQPYQVAFMEANAYPVLCTLKYLLIIFGLLLIASPLKWLLLILALPYIHLFLVIYIETNTNLKAWNSTSGKMLLWIFHKARPTLSIIYKPLSLWYGYRMKRACKKECNHAGWEYEIFNTYYGDKWPYWKPHIKKEVI
jgi:hypothetical protein